jgi:glycosyltransferase involved in cell wall biosynthesis
VVNAGYAERFDFPILHRPAVVECLVDSFRADACVVSSRADLAALRRTDRPIALVLFGGDVTPAASNHFLGRPAYLRTLASSDFALCPPGVFMPHSHNLIEALAVGAVPVLNYADFCRPRLVDGVDCLGFATPDGLIAAVRRALAMAPAEVEPLRRAAARRYDLDLSPEAAARRLARFLARPGPGGRLVLNREFGTARAWSAARALG